MKFMYRGTFVVVPFLPGLVPGQDLICDLLCELFVFFRLNRDSSIGVAGFLV